MKRSDYGMIVDFNAWAHPAWVPFTELMEGRQYGNEPLNQAWAFFRAGREARKKDEK